MKSFIRPFVAVLAIIGMVTAIGPWWSNYEFGADEGFNLQKAVLVVHGYRLYADIWSDQPPFLTYVLAGVHLAFPFSIFAARATILVFAGLLAACLFRVTTRFDGPVAGWASVFLLASSSLYLELSVAVMIGLPAVALAMLSVDLAMSGRPGTNFYRAAAAGVAFALALLTKLFVLLILPAVLVGLWLTAFGRGQAGRQRAALATLCFLAASAATAAIMFLVVQGFSADQLFRTHVAARSLKAPDVFGGFWHLFDTLMKRASAAFLFTVLFGLAAFWKRPTSVLLVPILWVAVSLLALAVHHPIWVHQVLIIVPPLCWLGGVGLKSLFVRGERLRIVDVVADHPDRRIRLAGWTLVLAIIPVAAFLARENVRLAYAKMRLQSTADEQMASTSLMLFSDASDVLITDKPIDAYHMRKAVPPNLAVWSFKRAVTGRVTDEEVLREVEARPDSQVMMRRHAHSSSFLDRIAQHTPRVGFATNRYWGSPIAFFARGTATSALESQLLGYLSEVTAKSLGGLTDMANGRRLDRPMSKAALPERAVVARPPGSAQELGACLVAASRVSQSKPLLLEALGVGRALACVQTASGGWKFAASPADRCVNRSDSAAKPSETLDDGTVPSILYFLFDLSDRLSELAIAQPKWLDQAIARALAFAIRTQQDDGSWPQRVAAGNGYHRLATLNDDTTTGMIRVLLAVYRRDGSPAHLKAAQRGGEFLLRAQGADGQAAFAQQYDQALKPAPARKFEPAAYASLETAYAINALIDLHLATDDQRYLAAARAAAEWLKKNKIKPNEWARLYEIGTSRPIYANRSGAVTYELEDLPAAEIKSYRWTGGRDVFPEIGIALDRLERLREGVGSLTAYDRSVAAASLLPATPTARLPLIPAAGAITPETIQSTRKFAEYCAGLIAARAADPSNQAEASNNTQN